MAALLRALAGSGRNVQGTAAPFPAANQCESVSTALLWGFLPMRLPEPGSRIGGYGKKETGMTIIVGTALADLYGHMDGRGHMDGWDDSGWMWILGTIMMLAIVALIGVGIWALLRSQSRHTSEAGVVDATASARAILAERFARGEISAEEYRERLDHLRV